jgi:hypothetical protein
MAQTDFTTVAHPRMQGSIFFLLAAHRYNTLERGEWPDVVETLGELAYVKPVIADLVIGRKVDIEEGSRKSARDASTA